MKEFLWWYLKWIISNYFLIFLRFYKYKITIGLYLINSQINSTQLNWVKSDNGYWYIHHTQNIFFKYKNDTKNSNSKSWSLKKINLYVINLGEKEMYSFLFRFLAFENDWLFLLQIKFLHKDSDGCRHSRTNMKILRHN